MIKVIKDNLATPRLDNFKPLPLEIVKAVFGLAEVKKGEKHLDLGSGDGRMVVEGLKHGADSIGYEIQKELADKCREQGINVVNADIWEVDVSDADLITAWFSKKPGTEILGEKLHKEMKKGARLVMADFRLSKWEPVKEIFPRDLTFFSKYRVCLYIKE